MPANRPHCVYPPTDYSVTLPEVVDFHRKHNPYETAYIFSRDGTSAATNVSFLEFGRAADRVAHYLRPGRGGQDRQVIAFVAQSDTLLYQAVTVGITRAGYIPYPMSPRNTAAAIVKLLKDTECHWLLTTYQTLGNLVDQVKAELAGSDPSHALSIHEVPPLHDIFPKLGQEIVEDAFEEYPVGARPDLDEVLMYLHSSGSTGFPKTIAQTFRSMVHWASLPPVTDNITYKVPLTMAGHALPAFHTLGIIVQLLISLYAMTPVGLYPPIASTPTSTPMVPSPDNILDHIARSGCNCLTIIPALLQVWAQDPKAVSLLASIEFVAYSGGAVPSKLGNFMTDAGVYITPVYGATEFGAVSKFFRKEGDEKDWEWIWFSDDISIRWDAQGDGTHEIQFLTSERHQVSVENLPNMRGYATSDLWVQHPTKSYFWKIVGRRDDVIVHTSGEKTVPAPFEDILMSNPYITGAIMFGRSRDHAGVLIELKPAHAIDTANPAALTAARDKLWPIVEEANRMMPKFSRVFKEMILFVREGKPLPRAGKGTVMKAKAVEVYAEEIDEIYKAMEATEDIEVVVPPPSWDIANVETWLSAQVADVHSARVFDTKKDLFEQGMDRQVLSATILRRRILGALKENEAAAKLVTQATMYNNPTIAKLAAFLVHVVADPVGALGAGSRVEEIEAMIAKYSAGLMGLPTAQTASADSQPVQAEGPEDAVVLLTGSTGNLGAQLLEALLRDSRVRRVYALNRPSGGAQSITERHRERFADKGLDARVLESGKLIFLEGEAALARLGLADSVYDGLRRSVTTIIHNAWRLDFNLALSSFEANIQATRSLVDLARAAHHAAQLKLLFTSSISAAFSWDQTRGAYPEEVVEDARYAVGNGYGESKYVAERILTTSGLNATSFRIGQISGGQPNGAWATSDWVPILVKSSLHINALPSAAGVTSWIPMDAVSQTILDVAWSSESHAALNVVHPRPVAWNTIIMSINDALVAEGVAPGPLPLIAFSEWVARLEAHAADPAPETLANIPAIKLLDFFRFTSGMDAKLRLLDAGAEEVETGGLATFATEKVQGISGAMAQLPCIGQADVQRWVRYWKGTGFVFHLR